MNFSFLFALGKTRAMRTRISACAAILLLNMNLAVSAQAPQSQAPPPDSQPQTQPAPDSPAPAANGTTTATPTLAHAGDLPRTTDKPQQVLSPAESARHPAGDACQAAFTQVVDFAPSADRSAKDAMNTIRRSDTGPM